MGYTYRCNEEDEMKTFKTTGLTLNAKELQEWQRLDLLWATQKATKKQILRCLDLSRKAKANLS
jgi:hypothetical protein